ncbi:ABC transporter substrate-binding protein [Natrialba swarupiae]|nr:ABC transporter substrate-binding protein [Natrialba swarupiae]
MADYDTIVSRREILAVTGAAGAAALAGCSDDASGSGGNGGNGGDGTTDPGEDVPDHADVYFQTADGEHQVSDFQFNPHQWGGYSHISFALYAEWANYIIDQGEYYPHAVADWEVTDTTMTLHISDEFTWGNGDDITADDFMMQLELGEAMDDSLYDFVDEVEVVDDYTIEITYPEGTNQEIIEHVVLDRDLDHPPADWGDLHEAYLDGEDVTDDLFGHEVEEPTPSGFVDLTELGEQQATFDVREDSPVADNVNWNGYQVGYRSGNEAFHQSFATGELDGVHSLFAGPGALQQFPDTLEQVQVPGGFGLGMVFNYDHEHFGEREVRQAFAYAIDSETAILSVGADSKMEFPVQGGLTVPATHEWLDTDEYKSYDQDVSRTEELLQEAGFERNDDDIWERDGSELEVDIIVPAGWSDWVTPTSTIVDQLSQAGFAAELNSQDQGVWQENLSSGNFSVAAYGHTEGGNASMNHPYFSFTWKLENRDHGSANFFSFPEDEAITVPDGDGGEISVNPREELSAIANTNDDAELHESVGRLARLFNEDLPMLLIDEKFEQSFLSRDGWQFPAQEESQHFQAFWPLYWLAKQDELKATTAAED